MDLKILSDLPPPTQVPALEQLTQEECQQIDWLVEFLLAAAASSLEARQ